MINRQTAVGDMGLASSHAFPTTICFHFVLANVTAGCCCGKLELIGASAKMSQVVTPEAQSIFDISIPHLAAPTWQPKVLERE